MTEPSSLSPEEITTAIREQLETLRTFQTELSRARERHEVLRLKVAELEAAAAPYEPPAAGVGPVDWAVLTGAERARLIGGLAEFVDGLVERERLQDTVLSCWWKHPAAVEELGALWLARTAAYRPGGDGSHPIMWRVTLENALPRLRRMFMTCHEGHDEGVARTGPWRSDVDAAEFEAYVRGLTPARETAEAQPPSSTEVPDGEPGSSGVQRSM